MKPTSRALLTLLALTIAACQGPQTEPEIDMLAAAHEVQSSIDEATLRAPIAELSSDAYEGRGPSSKGDEMTQAYLAAQMEALGLEPGASDDEEVLRRNVQQISAVIEREIRACPGQWIWTHRRWRTRPDGVDRSVVAD